MTISIRDPVAAPKVVGPQMKTANRPPKELPSDLIDPSRLITRVPFDAHHHLSITQPEKIVTMENIGLQGQGISTTAFCTPFSLFSEAAIDQIRAELFSELILASCQFTSDFAKNMIRGYNRQ